MTAAAAKPTLAERSRADELGILRDIPIEDLRIAEWNARKSLDPIALAELKDSIREHGIQVPLLVRILPISAWKSLDDETVLKKSSTKLYEIVAGHRRFRVAQELAFVEVPCIVRELTDDEARERGLVDNVQREDVPALEEADAYGELEQRLGSPAAIAARVGKPIEYIVRRLKLRTLFPFMRVALAERLITLDHALLIAKLGQAEQEQALRYTLDRNVTVKQKTEDVLATAKKEFANGRANKWEGSYWAPQSIQRLKQWIEEETQLQLGRAPWDLKDATLLPAAGACSDCPKNTAANAPLFGDLAIKAATCTDAGCFNQKRQAFVQLTLDAVAEAGAAAVRVSWNGSTSKPRFLKDEPAAVNPAQIFKVGQWIEAKKGSCDHILTGVTVDFPKREGWGEPDKAKRPGRQLLVCVAAKCRVHPKTWERAASKSTNGGTHYGPKAEEERREKLRTASITENKIRLAAAGAAIEKITKLPEAALRAMLLEVASRKSAQEAWLPQLKKTLATEPIWSVAFARAVAVISIESLQAWEYVDPKRSRPEFLASLKRIGHDGSGAWVQAKREQKNSAVAKPAKKPPIAKKAAKAIHKMHPKKAAKKGGRG